jgi:hypothetical protein
MELQMHCRQNGEQWEKREKREKNEENCLVEAIDAIHGKQMLSNNHWMRTNYEVLRTNTKYPVQSGTP